MQWSSIGAATLRVGEQSAVSVIDPEALVLLSLAMQDEERRLRDVLVWWARVGSELLSVQRMKRVADKFPDHVRELLGGFAYMATEAGDKRWSPHASETASRLHRESKKGPAAPDIADASALILRLRAGFGVSAKPDVLAFLIGCSGRDATIRTITQATGYSEVAVRDAARHMARARFIRAASSHPVSYFVHVKPWAELLEFRGSEAGTRQLELYDLDTIDPGHRRGRHQRPEAPAWRFWSDIFAFLAHVDNLERCRQLDSASPYMQSTSARDLYEEHRTAFAANNIDVPDPNQYKGVAYLDAFQETLRVLSDWIADSI